MKNHLATTKGWLKLRKIGGLDVAERCYKRAIADAGYLERIKDEMDCLYSMTSNVYYIWVDMTRPYPTMNRCWRIMTRLTTLGCEELC